MNKKAVIAAIAAVSIPWTAHALDRGYICYQGFDRPNPTAGAQTPTAVFECRAEPGGFCAINPGHIAYTYLGAAIAAPGTTNSAWYQYYSTAYDEMSATVTFQSATGALETHTCTVALHPSGWPKDALVGYTTDASGRVTTGVWKHRSDYEANMVGQTYRAPPDFVHVGGGVVGVEAPFGALIYRSDGVYGTRDNVAVQIHRNDAYAIGMKIEGFGNSYLQSVITDVSTYMAGTQGADVAHPYATNEIPWGRALLSGGVVASSTGYYPTEPRQNGQYVFESFPTRDCVMWGLRPILPTSDGIYYLGNSMEFYCAEYGSTGTGWQVSSKDHFVSRPGTIAAKPRSIETTITDSSGQVFIVHSRVFTATSPVAQHPSVVVAGAPGEYALTGIGAKVDWRSHGDWGNLLWKLMPRPDIGGAEVGSKDHLLASPATIQGFAIGIKLEPL